MLSSQTLLRNVQGVLHVSKANTDAQIIHTTPMGVQVLRGYVGDRNSKPVFEGNSPFNILGTGYQRPFELATLRLFNMVGILPRCECAHVTCSRCIAKMLLR